MNAVRNDMQATVEPPSPSVRLDSAVDAWIHQTLAERFDSTLNEALPAELTALLNGLH